MSSSDPANALSTPFDEFRGRRVLVTGASSDLVNEARACGANRAELAEVPSPRVPQLLAQQPADAAARAGIRQSLLGSLGLDLGAPAAPVVLTICRIAPQKNLPVLVQAAAQLRQACTWVVVGEGDPQLLAQLRAQVSALGAPVHFVGSSREVDTWLRGAEVFVLPSQWEARALVVQEAMAAGTPVVVADVGGLHGLVLQAGELQVLRPAGRHQSAHRVLAHDSRVDLDVGIAVAPAGQRLGQPTRGALGRGVVQAQQTFGLDVGPPAHHRVQGQPV